MGEVLTETEGGTSKNEMVKAPEIRSRRTRTHNFEYDGFRPWDS